MSKVEKMILERTSQLTAKSKTVVELQCMMEGCTANEVAEAMKNLFRDGKIFISHVHVLIKKT